MTKPAVYLETSVICYATARPTRDLIVAGHQQITREWFALQAQSYDLFISKLVESEVSDGDQDAAAQRLDLIREFPRLAVTDATIDLAEALVNRGAVPQKAPEDAIHIATAAVHGVDYLLTWHCKHIANARMRHAIEDVCIDAGYEPPTICTPEELMSDDDS